MKSLNRLFASDNQMPLNISDGTATQGQLARRLGLTDRTIRDDEASAMEKLRTAFRNDPELGAYALTHPQAVAAALATSHMLSRHRLKSGFTLIELLVAIVIIGGLCVLGFATLHR